MRFSSSLRRALMGATAAIAVASGANAAIDVSVGIDTTGQPLYNRVNSGTPPVTLNAGGVEDRFVALNFATDVTGNVTVTNFVGGNSDTFLTLYSPSFDPALPLANAITANDDTIGLTAQVTSNITAGSANVVVGTGFGGGNFGTSTLQFTGADANTLFILGDIGGTGGATVNQGTLSFGDLSEAGAPGTGNVVVNVGAAVQFSRSNNQNFTNNTSGDGTVIVATNPGNTISFSGNLTHLGGTIALGNLIVDGPTSGNGGLFLFNYASGGGVFGSTFRGTGATVNGNLFVDTLASFETFGPRTSNVVNGNVTNNGLYAGNSTVNGNFANNGVINPGNSPGSIWILGNYAAGAPFAVLNSEVQFSNAAAPINGTTHDFLNIGGNVTGVTRINVIPFAPSGNPVGTTGNGIELVRVGGTVAPTAFLTSNRVFGGGFEYLLTHVPNFAGTADGFFLQSAAREELSLNAVILSASRNHIRNTYVNAGGDVHEADWGNKARAWISGMFQSTQVGLNAGVRHNLDDWSVSGGVDHEITSNFRLGIKGSYGNTEGDVWVRQGAMTVEGDTWSVLGTAHYMHGGFYADLSAGYASTDWDVRRALNPGGLLGTFGVASNVDVDGVVGHFDAGYRIKTDDIFTLTFAGQVFYNDMDCGTNCLFAAGTLPQSIEDTSDWVGRLEAKLEAAYSGGKIRPWVAVNYTDTLDGDGHSVRMGNAEVFSETANNLLGVDIGMQAQIAANLDLTIQAGMQQGLVDDVQSYQGQVGLKYRW
jgi:hypothetical protein